MREVTRVALITGGSGGIGLALAHVFARHGHNLLIVARDNNRLQAAVSELSGTYGVACESISLDLSLNGSVENLIQEVKARHLTVDVLVNNAGFGTWGEYWNIEPQRSEQEMYLNMVAPALLTKHFVQEMVERGSGKILNVASTASYQPGPLMSIYYATKAFVVSFSEALSKELSTTGVSITVLCPGPTETKFHQHAGMAKMHLLRQLFMMDAGKVADAAYDGLLSGKRVVIPGVINKLVASLVRFLPKVFILSVVQALHKRRG